MKNIIIFNQDKKSKLESLILKGENYSVQVKHPDDNQDVKASSKPYNS